MRTTVCFLSEKKKKILHSVFDENHRGHVLGAPYSTVSSSYGWRRLKGPSNNRANGAEKKQVHLYNFFSITGVRAAYREHRVSICASVGELSNQSDCGSGSGVGGGRGGRPRHVR